METDLMALQTPKERDASAPTIDDHAVTILEDARPGGCCFSAGHTHYLFHKGGTAMAFPSVCHVGPNWPCMTFTFALILAPSFICSFDRNITAWVIAVLVLSIVLTFLSFAMVACSDPGIIREDYVNPAGEDEGVLCAHCRIRRPANAVHCYECEVCIDGLDHHCPWTGKCIGKRTLKWFYLFLTMITLHLTFSISVLVYYIIRGTTK
ncbi:hypothetical protein SDRG_07329 [Saprolegnia diclina VS20]|uniref:Palmitoyltransferase n=1 Tax=Saprolegnia diclina (strain VS20) TaxID=1156394 RepID=T0QMP4_SAPDV|nr:hypothetical protein SDRG_07329 [Saprolegnia diclina VS20]EQC35095.1 hypothetical protein SDRG_07329 [Saprolegnia diclina VS20]|eukprot:XP_008611379.1 hypothetical protein SDRG_07329 [Saprolegnia diclina VS20]